MRKTLVEDITARLQQHGFSFVSFPHIRSSFDIVARRDRTLILLKVLENIDALTKEQAVDLSTLSLMLDAASLVVGVRSKAYVLSDGILYERYGIPALSVSTFTQFLEESYPDVRKFHQETINIDGEKLRAWRREHNVSINELSHRTGISRTMLYRYEHERATATEESYHALSRVVGDVRKPFTLRPSLFEERREAGLCSLGFTAATVHAAPFDVIAKQDERILVGKDVDPRTMKKRSSAYKQLTPLFDALAFFILTRNRCTSLHGIPVIHTEELRQIGNARDLLKLVRERSA